MRYTSYSDVCDYYTEQAGTAVEEHQSQQLARGGGDTEPPMEFHLIVYFTISLPAREVYIALHHLFE